jgi:DNA-binding transcriptional LysR family regulator
VIVACRSNGFDPVVGQVVAQVTSALSLVSAELGVSVVPASITQLQVRGVTYQPIHGSAPAARLALAVRRDSRQIVVQNFIHGLVIDPFARSRSHVGLVASRPLNPN